MKLTIERSLFWFINQDDLVDLNHKFYFLGNLLNRLLCHEYNGKKLKFLNLEFYNNSDKLIKAYGKEYFLHYYGGQLTYKKVVDLNYFLKLNYEGQKLFIWEQAYEMLQFASKELKNDSLLISSDYAYKKGLELNLNADYRMIDKEVVLFGVNYKAAVWLNFLENEMHANFTLEKDNNIVFKKYIEKGPNGMGFFFVMFKKIEQIDNLIIIKGVKDLEYLPLKLFFSENLSEIFPNNDAQLYDV